LKQTVLKQTTKELSFTTFLAPSKSLWNAFALEARCIWFKFYFL
jgi:hypothetical protein